tara:strand:- start:2538 stop:4067 length:1530 start_codon:yes stop_codon:yes gene_type:complete
MLDKEKIIIGSSNFYNHYGFNSSILKKTEINKILLLSRKSKIKSIDISSSYDADLEHFYKSYNFKDWKFSFKISKKKNNILKNKFKSRQYFTKKLKQLNKKKIDYLLFHNPKDLLSSWGKKVFKNLLNLQMLGIIEKIGVSIYDPKELRKILRFFKINVIQVPINLLDQRFIEKKVLRIIKNKNIEIHARSIFLQGLILNQNKKFSKYKEIIKLNQTLLKKKIDPIKACLEFVFSNKSIDKVIIGIKSDDELSQIIKSKIDNKFSYYKSLRTTNRKIIDPRVWPKNKILCILQVRTGPRMLSAKVLKKIDKKHSVLELMIKRIEKSKFIDQLVISCPNNINDRNIINICKKKNIKFYFGPNANALKRYFQTYKSFGGNTIIRLTADCPFVDPYLIDTMVKKFLDKKVDYLSNTLDRTFPDGLDIEIFKSSALEFAHENASSKHDKEHVTPYLKRSKSISKYSFKNKENFSKIRITLDYLSDLKVLRGIVNKFSPNVYFTWKDVIKYIRR